MILFGFFYIFKYIFLVLIVLIRVAFFTLLERKVLGIVQSRKGPYQVGFLGLVQPISDAVKLFLKEQNNVVYGSSVIFFIAPVFSFWLSLYIWLRFPNSLGSIDFLYGSLFFLSVLSVGVYGVILGG